MTAQLQEFAVEIRHGKQNNKTFTATSYSATKQGALDYWTMIVARDSHYFEGSPRIITCEPTGVTCP